MLESARCKFNPINKSDLPIDPFNDDTSIFKIPLIYNVQQNSAFL